MIDRLAAISEVRQVVLVSCPSAIRSSRQTTHERPTQGLHDVEDDLLRPDIDVTQPPNSYLWPMARSYTNAYAREVAKLRVFVDPEVFGIFKRGLREEIVQMALNDTLRDVTS